LSGIAVIGAGYWGKNLVRNVARLDRLVAVCDVSPGIRERMSADYPEARVTSELSDVLEDERVAAVMIAVPAGEHFEVARRALLAGKHTYVEKPITLDVGEAEELVSLAAERDLRLMVGHLLLFHPCVSWMKETLDSGDLGRVLYLTSNRLNLGKVRSDENAMWSLAPHDVSVALHLLGDRPVEVSAQGFCYLQQRSGIEDVVFLTLRFADGRAAHIHVSWLDPHKERSLTVVGSRKMVTFDDMSATEKLRIYDKGVDGVEQLDQAPAYGSYAELLTLRSGDVVIPHVAMKEPLALLCQHFADCVDSGATPLTDGVGGVEVLRVLAAAQKSLEAGGKPIALEERP
jgi:predicted dehydrogenase